MFIGPYVILFCFMTKLHHGLQTFNGAYFILNTVYLLFYQEIIMKTLNVSGIHCENCIARISKALKEKDIAFETSLENKTVSVDEANVTKTIEVLDDLGFEAKE